jgi:hypothetical protein
MSVNVNYESTFGRVRQNSLVVSALIAMAAVMQTNVLARSMPPVDEAGKDPSLQKVRAQLLTVISRHDKKALLPWLDPDIQYAHGGGAGIHDFIENWGIGSKGSDFWGKMEFALKHGGYFEKGRDFYSNKLGWIKDSQSEFIAPYYLFYCDNEQSFAKTFGKFDDGCRANIISRNLPLHSQPNPEAPIIANLSYDLVRVDAEADQRRQSWTKVMTTDGTCGFVETNELSFQTDPIAVFRKIYGNWRLIWFGYDGP